MANEEKAVIETADTGEKVLTKPADLRKKLIAIVSIQHPHPAVGELNFKVRRGLTVDMAFGSGVPVGNPLIGLAKEPDAKGKETGENAALQKQARAYLRAIAKAAMLEPTFDEMEDLIGDDVIILSAIAREVTGLNAFGNMADIGGTFRG